MPKGPNGEYRPTDPMQRAVRIGMIATGQIPDDRRRPDQEKKEPVQEQKQT